MHPYGWLSLVPPIVAVTLAIVTRRVLTSLLLGVFAGALVMSGGDPLGALVATFETHLWPTFIEPDKLRLFSFTMSMGATIGLLHAAGGMLGFVKLMTPLASTPRSGQLTGWLMGLAIFFDDYANTLLLGGALGPVFDRLKVSREKLAYIVDSTAAPVAGLALVSTWIAVELAYVQEGLANLPGGAPEGVNALNLFVACLPYRFYVIQALAMVFLIAVLGREFGPMLAAERAARARPDGVVLDEAGAGKRQPTPTHWSNAVAPLGAMLAVVLALLCITGSGRLVERLGPEAAAAAPWREVFGAANSAVALQYGGLVGLGVALAIVAGKRLLTKRETTDALVRGVLVVLPAVAILWFASAMSRMTSNKAVDGRPTATPYEHAGERLYTGEYLTPFVLGDTAAGEQPSALVRALLPTGVFLLSCAISFATGTSFGTMGLVVPLAVPIGFAAAGGDPALAATSPLLLATLGSVLAGAIFGDHCSPISDTTILSSQASGCDHMAHVRTQMPYALVPATMSVLLGTIPVALGVNVWLLLPLQTAALLGVLYVFGRRV
ncbi:MAG: Na+/H+ antiporter NhaC family protein [Lacipirellulaceae bacterium]